MLMIGRLLSGEGRLVEMEGGLRRVLGKTTHSRQLRRYSIGVSKVEKVLHLFLIVLTELHQFREVQDKILHRRLQNVF